MRARGRIARRAILFAVVPLALLASGVVVWQASYSAFTQTTSNGSNSWTTGTVKIDNDQAASAVFSVTGLKPDSSLSALSPPGTFQAFAASDVTSGGSKCIKVTYSGSVNANIKLYANLAGDTATLGTWMLLTVDTVTGDTADAADPTCGTNRGASTYVYGASGTTTDKFASFPTTAGGSSMHWDNVANGWVMWFRFSWLLPSSVTQTVTTAKNVTATFNWEADSV
jgi:hypothetical protein